jgi:hypothetical protein
MNILDQMGVQPGATGLIPEEKDSNPNHAPDIHLRRQLGPPLGYNPVAEALNRRETLAEAEKAIAQLIEQDPSLSRLEAIQKVKLSWSRTAPVTPSSTSPPPESITVASPQNSNPLPPASQRPIPNPQSPTTPSVDTPRPALTPEPDSQAGPTIEQIQAALNSDLTKQEVGAVRSDQDGGPEGGVSGTTTSGTAEASGTQGLNPFLTKIFADVTVAPQSLDEEFEADVKATLHPSTEPLLKYLPRRNCIQFFRQSLAMAGLPKWSRWTPKMRTDVEAAYQELASDRFEVNLIVERLQSFSVQYGKSRLLRMVATILGLQAWMSMEVPNG